VTSVSVSAVWSLKEAVSKAWFLERGAVAWWVWGGCEPEGGLGGLAHHLSLELGPGSGDD
jgi:hypothetical protein